MNPVFAMRRGRAGSRVLAGLLTVTWLGTGCARSTPIGTLVSEGVEWDGRTVRVTGEVGEALGLLGFGAYAVRDGTGTITVVSRTGGAPATGTRVTVEGTFRVAATVGPRTVTVIQESRRTER